MKSKFCGKIKSRRFLFALLTAVIMYGFAVFSSKLWAHLIPYRFLEIIVWFIVYFGLLVVVLWNWDDWFDKYVG